LTVCETVDKQDVSGFKLGKKLEVDVLNFFANKRAQPGKSCDQKMNLHQAVRLTIVTFPDEQTVVENLRGGVSPLDNRRGIRLIIL
jgi:hypothetical protein